MSESTPSGINALSSREERRSEQRRRVREAQRKAKGIDKRNDRSGKDKKGKEKKGKGKKRK